MQLYALQNNVPYLATQAKRGENYVCPECSGAVRLRSGPHVRAHFYHLSTPASCRQHQKGEEHIQLQLLLYHLLPGAVLERPFPTIGRIADVYWETHKMVIEIQCSPIPLEEAASRCQDYASLGLKTLWILHDKRFNKRRLSAAEHFLRSSGSLFTNMDKSGQGYVYDQCETLQSFSRIRRGPPIPIDLSQPFQHQVPLILDKAPSPFWQKAKKLYLSFLYALLEKCCERK